MKKRIMSAALVLALCLNMLPAGVSAAESDAAKECSHHPEHTAECGYVEEVPESPCIHEHTEACYEFVTQCIHEHTDECYSEVSDDTPEEGGDESDTEQTGTSDREDSGADTEQSGETDAEQGDKSDTEKSDESDAEQSDETDAEKSGETDAEQGGESDAKKKKISAGTSDEAAESEEQSSSDSDAGGDRSLNCGHECSEESGCIIRKLHCTHEHNEDCGYAEEIPGQPCGYVCKICPLQELIDALPKEITEKNREDVIVRLDEILEKYKALTEEEKEQVNLSRYGKLRDMLKEESETAPYYLFVLHSLEVDGELYGGTQLIELDSDEIKNKNYDLHGIVMQKEGMEPLKASCYDDESGELKESWTVSRSDFVQAGDPEDGSDYYAVQAVIEYGVADGYTAVVPENPEPADDPYGIMPLVGFTGGNIEDIEFVPANIVTITVNYMYSPTGGLSGMPAAAPRQYQVAVTKDEDASLEVEIPSADGDYPNLEGFRIVLNSEPLNAFLVNPSLANEMSVSPDADTIKNAMENDLFTIDTTKNVYKSDSETGNTYGNDYSIEYNEAWNSARSFKKTDNAGEIYTATASSGTGAQNLGATPLTQPKLTVTIPTARVNQVLEAGADSEAVKEALTVTVYYRRNAGTYTVNHWIPNLSADEQAGKPQKTEEGVTYWNVYEETKQGRIGAMTNAISGMDQMDREGVDRWLSSHKFDFRPYVTQGFAQQIVDAGGGTEVDIYYGSASEYRIIFDTNDTYIPRVSANANDTLTFDYTANSGTGQLKVTDSSGNEYDEPNRPERSYRNPTRTGYRFMGWKYEVKEEIAGVSHQEGGKHYVYLDDTRNYQLAINDANMAVIVLATGDASTVKAIYLEPIWEEATANVRVVFWTEDLGGGSSDVDVDVTGAPSGSCPYTQSLGSNSGYLNGTPDAVSDHSFSNAGSFTFTATTGDKLNLSVNGSSQLATTTSVSDFSVTGDASVTGNLTDIINNMFEKRMPGVSPAAGASVNTSVFYHPYEVVGADSENNFTVAADGSTVINVRYARNVYGLDFTYYGTAEGNLSVAINTIGYSLLDNPANYGAQNIGGTGKELNEWRRVVNFPVWTVPQGITIRAKYGADLREVWPRTYGETIALNHATQTSATFVSWGTTAGGYNAKFKADREESTLMGVYSAMGVDIIANPQNSNVTHHMYAYWCVSRNPSRYRYNHCFEVPELTWDELTDAVDTETYNLRNKTVAGEHNQQTADVRADILYLVPVNGTLKDKFEDYDSVLLRVNAGGEVSGSGAYYAVRRYENGGNQRVYALARQVDAISTNTVENQNPSARLHMTRANEKPDHATNASDTDGHSTYDDNRNHTIGSAANPYDLFFYYDRDRMTITYMVPARDSDSGEYTLGTKEVPYGASLTKYNVKLDGNPSSTGNNGTPDNKRYSNDPKFADFWEAYTGTNNSGEGLNSGYARTAPNSAVDGKGKWTFREWSLDRALTQSADFTGTMTGNLRLFANWEEPKYQVTFELAGGVLADGTLGPIEQKNLLANQGYTSNENADIPRPTRNGYTLTGWDWFEEDGRTPVSDFTFETPITRNMVTRAHWETYVTVAYRYKVWYLTNDSGTVTRKENPDGRDEGWIAEGNPGANDHKLTDLVNTANYNKVLGCRFLEGEYPEGTKLLLGAESFAGYIPYNGNASILLEEANPTATADTTTYVAYFYYNKARMKQYKIQFQPVNLSGSNVGGVLSGITQEGETDKAYFTPSDESFKALREAGYQLVQMNADGSVVMENGKPKAAHNVSDLKSFIDEENRQFAGKTDETVMEVTFKVMPITYNISYAVGTLTGQTAGADTTKLKEAMAEKLKDLENQADGGAVVAGASSQNPTSYDVSNFNGGFKFTLKNPTYVQNPDNPAEWWQFNGWRTGTQTGAEMGFDSMNLEISHAVGNLQFLADWERAEAGLTVTNKVITNSGLTTIPDEAFEYTLTLPADTDPAGLFAYKTDAKGTITEFTIPANGKFTLKNGETMSFGGLTGNYTVTQTITGDKFDNSRKNYFKLVQVTVDGIADAGAVTSGTVNDSLGTGDLQDAVIFTNEYMTSTDLDTDPTPGNQGFPVTKYLLENGVRRDFFGGNDYTFTIRAGALSAADTPLPNQAADGGHEINLRSTVGVQSLNGAFDSVRFTKTGTYTYVIREGRPDGEGVPGVSYDSRRYRITVEVAADEADATSLQAKVTRVESRTTEDTSGGTDTGWTVMAGGADNLSGSIVFENTYNTTQVSRTFQPVKELTGRDTPLAAGEFTFTLTPAGSVSMTQAQAQAYHNAATDDAKLTWLKNLDNSNSFTADNDQPMPGNVGADRKVTNGESGAIIINPITYTSAHMGGAAYGKVYKYTISEEVPAGAVDGKYNGIVYDTDTRTLYVYVHLHNTDGNLAALGDTDTLVYADVLGDRNATFTNTYETAPVTVDVGGDGDPAAGIIGIPFVKQLTGRDFTVGDSFTFTLTADTPLDAPLPKNEAGEDVNEVIITPESGSRVNVPFGRITFTQTGTYVYELREQPGDAEKMTYDTEPKTLTITVTDDGTGRLTAVAAPAGLTWTNRYATGPGKDTEKEPGENPEDNPGGGQGSGEGSGSGTDSASDSGSAENPGIALAAAGAEGGGLPQTGMLWWPVWILAAAGIVLLGIGIVRKKTSRGDNEE